jgi:hypothetical protein
MPADTDKLQDTPQNTPQNDTQRNDTQRDTPQPTPGARPTGAKDDPHLAPESGDKPDAATPARGQTPRGPTGG